MMNNISITELAELTREAYLKFGLSERTICERYYNALQPIIKFHHQHQKECFDRITMDKYVRFIQKRKERNEIGDGFYNQLRRGAENLTEMYDIGKIVWSCPNLVSKYKLNDYFQVTLDAFMNNGSWHSNTRGDILWVSKKFFAWLIDEGYETLEKVGASELQSFMIYCANHMRSTSLHNVKLYMKKLCNHLYETGSFSCSFRELLSFPVSRESRQFPTTTFDEIAAVISTIDRCTSKGKRDYAMILLAVVTGLRSVDIAQLKLSDINWQVGEIKTTQSKTGNSIVLPLTEDVGTAIRDYILKGRHKTDCREIFLRERAPFQAFIYPSSIGDMYRDYRKKAGLTRVAFDGKGFHSLRRTLGTNLVKSGAEINMVAQILGDADINSTKKYIAFDNIHLKAVALDFTGIKVEVEK